MELSVVPEDCTQGVDGAQEGGCLLRGPGYFCRHCHLYVVVDVGRPISMLFDGNAHKGVPSPLRTCGVQVIFEDSLGAGGVDFTRQ